jgi:hypothetical protein
MKRVSLLPLLRDGTFGPLRIGSSREAVTSFLGRPSALSGIRLTPSGPDAILKYGDFEFHFSTPSGRHLTLIHADVFTGPGSTIASPSRVSLDSWVLRASLTHHDFIATATDVALSWRALPHPDPELTVLGTPVGAQVGFYTDPSAGEPPFLWLSLTERAA